MRLLKKARGKLRVFRDLVKQSIMNTKTDIKFIHNLPAWYLEYLYHIAGKSLIKHTLRDGTVLLVRPNTADRDCLRDIWMLEVYTGNKAFKIKPNDVIVDVGAHIGTFTLFAAKKARHGRIFAYEPAVANFQLLSRNVSLNHLSNVKCLNYGVAAKQGEKRLYIEGTNTSGHNIYGTGKFQWIMCITLKDIFEQNRLERISFLKMDCEGAEYEILLGLPIKYLVRIDKISLEYHRLFSTKFSSRDLVKLFEENGFLTTTKKTKEKAGMFFAVNMNDK